MYPHVTLKNDRYLTEILAAHDNDATRFDAVNVAGCRVEPAPVVTEVDHVEQCEDSEAQFWSVYLHLKPVDGFGGLECIGDFVTKPEAETYAREVATQYGYAQHF